MVRLYLWLPALQMEFKVGLFIPSTRLFSARLACESLGTDLQDRLAWLLQRSLFLFLWCTGGLHKCSKHYLRKPGDYASSMITFWKRSNLYFSSEPVATFSDYSAFSALSRCKERELYRMMSSFTTMNSSVPGFCFWMRRWALCLR